MKYRWHMLVGFMLYCVLTVLLFLFNDYIEYIAIDWEVEALIALPVMLYASILPDIDIKTSKAFQITWIFGIIIILFFIFVEMLPSAVILLFILMCTLFLKHRGFMHNPITAVIIGVVFGFLFSSFIIGLYVFVGYLSHSVLEWKPKKINYE